MYQLSVHIITSVSLRIPICTNFPSTHSLPFPHKFPRTNFPFTPSFPLPYKIPRIKFSFTHSLPLPHKFPSVPTLRSHHHFRFLINSPLYQLLVHTFTSVSLTKSHVPTFHSHNHFRFSTNSTHQLSVHIIISASPRIPLCINSPFTSSLPFPSQIPRINSPFTYSLPLPHKFPRTNFPFTLSFPLPPQNPTHKLHVHTFISASSQNPTHQLHVHIIISASPPIPRNHFHFPKTTVFYTYSRIKKSRRFSRGFGLF